MKEKVSTIVEAVQSVSSNNVSHVTIQPFTLGSSKEMEAVMFIKPEATELLKLGAEKLTELLSFCFSRFEKEGFTLGALSVLGGEYLKTHDIIARHYGVINKISRLGREAFSPLAHENLEKHFGEDLKAGAEVLGGHQFMARFPEFSPRAIDALVSNLGPTKLGPGTYCTKVKIDGAPYLLVNGFHPLQVEYFTAPGKSIIVATLRGEGSWKSWRNDLIGATNPAKGQEGSLRKTFLDKKDAFGFKVIDQGNNAVHFSAGPLEGMVEVTRYFTDWEKGKQLTIEETCFGKLLAESGVSSEMIRKYAENVMVSHEGKEISAFDLTEEMQPSEAVAQLTSSSVVE